MNYQRSQRGGTFLGLILGLVAGLAVALAVAVYVAKVPIPFVNKGATRTNGQDAAEAEKNKDWDPNALLRGKSTPATPASGTPVPPPAEVERGQAAADTPRPPEGGAATATPTPPPTQAARGQGASGDPLGDFANARTRRGGAQDTVDDSTLYYVQVGAFRSPEEAESQRARLLLAGVQAQVSEREQAGRPMYRVRVGPFQNRDAADRVKTRLAGDGFDAVLAGAPR